MCVKCGPEHGHVGTYDLIPGARDYPLTLKDTDRRKDSITWVREESILGGIEGKWGLFMLGACVVKVCAVASKSGVFCSNKS